VSAIATLSPTALQVEPGREVAAVVKVRNSGPIVDRFDVTIVGPMARFAVAEPAALSLFPGQEGEVRITFRPPRAPQPRAGTSPFGVRVAPAANPGGATVEEGRLTLLPFVEPTAEIVPMTSRGSRGGRHDVYVANKGNAPLVAEIVAADPDRLAAFSVEPSRITVAPGERVGATVRARPSDTFFVGSRRTLPFVVEIRIAGRETPISLRPTLLQGPILPPWLVPLAGLLVLALVAVIAIPRLTSPSGPRSVANETSAPTASPSPSPTASPTVDPFASASIDPNASGSSEPSPTPAPGPFELAIGPDEIALGGALTLRCPPQPEDSACRQTALDTVRVLITSLGAPFDGRGIVSVQNINAENAVPVVLARDIPFPWLAQGGATTDQTPRAVIDLAPLLATPPGFAYAVVDSSVGPRRFVLPDALARQLLETIYEPNPGMVDPAPVRTLPPFFTTVFQNDITWNFLATPAPNPAP
jgi:hypothetical protein